MSRNKWLAAALLASIGSTPVAAQQGTIMGQVVDRSTSQPLVGAQVYVVGTTVGALANRDGRYVIQGVPAGEHQVRATLIGYSSQSHAVTVSSGQTTQQDFQLGQSAIELGAVVVSASGQQQTLREIGSSVGVVQVDEVDLAPVATFSDLLQGRAAGAVVTQSSGNTGAGSRIRIRGSNSISLSNDPLLVIDGVRVDNSSRAFGLDLDQVPSALDDLNPEDIESIEILKGPAASALYGTAAANGVIQVTTRRGRSGQPEFRAWTEMAALRTSVDFPDNVQRLADTDDPTDPDFGPCPLHFQVLGWCTPGAEVFRANPLETDSTTIFDGGSRTVYGGSVSGGSDNATFYLSAEKTNEEAVYNSENELDRVNLQANVTGALGEDVRVHATVGYTETDLQLPLSDNALFGAVPMALFGDADPGSVASTGGYENPIQFHYDWKSYQDKSRLITSAGADYAPFPWLKLNGSAGLERIARQDRQRIPRLSSYEVFGGVYSRGWIQNSDYNIYNVNSNASASAVFDVTPELISTTTLGSQYIRQNSQFVYAFGASLAPGLEESLAGATTDFATSEANAVNATLSAYAQQQLAWRDRVFLNGAIRGDQNTAFGTDIGWIWYPSVSGSWVVSEEDFFPESDLLSELRIRGAVGQAGLRPGATSALLQFNSNIASFQNLDVPALTLNELGNLALEPERSTEWELGFEAGFLEGRFGLESTYYHKTSRDALVQRPLPYSPGGPTFQWDNLGEVRNSGFELLLTGEPVRSENVAWNFSLSGSINDNELVELGQDAFGNPIPPIGSGTQRFVEGYPLGGWWAYPIRSFEDADGDGLINFDEVEVGVLDADGQLVADSVAFMGDALPTRELSFGTDVTLFRTVRLSGLLDYKGGHEKLNFTRAWRCTYELNCEASFDPDTPLEDQAAVMALFAHNTYAGFIEDASFLKLRELALTFMLPTEWARAFQSTGLQLTLAGRNLATWTDYRGLDPEVAFTSAANFTSGDFATLPPNRMFTLRVDASF
jgi:TonB-linked SusC/RagA family outer membrane protein